MYLITRTAVRGEPDPKTGKMRPVVTHQAHVEENVDVQLELKAAGDDRVQDLRVFELTIDDTGGAKIGKELTS